MSSLQKVNQATTKTSVVNSRNRENKLTPTKKGPVATLIGGINSGRTNSKPQNKKTPVLTMPIMQTTEMTENQELSIHPVRPVVKRTTLQRKIFLKPMQQTDRLLGTEDRRHKIKIKNQTHRLIQLKVSRLRPEL